MSRRVAMRGLIVFSKMVTGIALCACLAGLSAIAGFGFNNGGQVGGISIDAQGVVRTATAQERSALLDAMRKQVAAVPQEMEESDGLRKVSLRKLQAAVAHAIETGSDIPDDVAYLGGIQRIEYVLVYPDKQDIVLAGKAEAWKVGDNGEVVGVKSGKPVLHFDDLLVAFRTVEAARDAAISCSIDPTSEGIENLKKFLSTITLSPNANATALEPAMQKAFGPQMVRLTGVPETSHLARVMVSADYHMKRIAMNIDPSPVEGLSSYLQLVARTGARSGSIQSRWWLACDYDEIRKSEDGLAFQISGRGIKAMTEEEIVGNDGSREQTGKSNKLAQKWADSFTENYDDLSVANPVFGNLRNIVDMCVVAALIEQNDLGNVAGCDLSVLKGVNGGAETAHMAIPKSIDPHCSFIKGAAGWVVSASGGVQVDSWTVVEKQIVDNKLNVVREENDAKIGQPWWWN
jgi:hypothetical protein